MNHAWDQPLGCWSIAENHPALPAVLASPSKVSLSFSQLAGRAHQLVHALRANGLSAGDIVAYALPNDVDVLYWQLAAQEGGFQSIALNPALSGAEIRTIVDHSGASAIALHSDYANRMDRLGGHDSVRLRVSVGGALSGWTAYQDLVAGQPQTLPVDRELGVPISYSSGTTGKPKAIVRRTMSGLDPTMVADQMKSFGHAFRFQPLHGVHLVSAGMHHGGCQSFYLGALNVGQAVAIMGKFDPERTLQMIEQYRVTTAYMVPTQFVRLLRLPAEVRERYDLSSLEVVVHSAAPCPPEIKQRMMDWWGPVIWETYGGMEGAATIAKPHRWLQKPGTVGRAIAGMRLKILDDDGNQLPPHELGNVYLEPAFSTFEYRDESELTASVKRGKAFTLGDIGYLDDDGYLFLRDRAKDMIISGGVNIYPAEIEGVLSAHPRVGDVAVIPIPDPEWGESVKAVVELDDGSVPTGAAADRLAGELIAFCRERLAGYKCPRTVDFRAHLPRTDGGKLYKRLLRDEYRTNAPGEAAEAALGGS
jgi:long-chain acyl-CoA synthetase